MTSACSPADTFVPPEIRKAAPYFVLVLAVLAAYGNVYDNDFVDDDKVLILRNLFLQDWHHLRAIFTTTITAGGGIAGGCYRPLQILIYLLIYQTLGASSFAFHFVNIALHTVNACLLYRLGGKLGFHRHAALFAALIWAVHPVQTEAITYMSGTADPLYVFFALASLLIALPDFTLRKCLIITPLFILGLSSKEDMLTFPLLAVSCLYLLRPARFDPRTYLCTWPLWLVAALYALMHRFVLSFGHFPFYPDHLLYSSSIVIRTYTCLATLPSYLAFIVCPRHLHFYRNIFPVLSLSDPMALKGLLLVVLAAAQIVYAGSRSAIAFGWGLLWFAGAHVLHTGILQPLNSTILEHWIYLPTAGLFLGIGEALASFEAWPPLCRKAAPGIGIAVALVLGLLTCQQNDVWHNEESFYLNILNNGERSLAARDNLGSSYVEHGEYEKAMAQFQDVIRVSGDRDAYAEYNMAIAILLLHNDSPSATYEAIGRMRRALEIDPGLESAAEKLALLYDRTGDLENAAIYQDKANAIRAALTNSAP